MMSIVRGAMIQTVLEDFINADEATVREVLQTALDRIGDAYLWQFECEGNSDIQIDIIELADEPRVEFFEQLRRELQGIFSQCWPNHSVTISLFGFIQTLRDREEKTDGMEAEMRTSPVRAGSRVPSPERGYVRTDQGPMPGEDDQAAE